MSRKIGFAIVIILVVAGAATLGWQQYQSYRRIVRIGFVSPSQTGPIKIGQSRRLTLSISTVDPINAAEMTVRYDPNHLDIKTIDTAGSAFTLWILDAPKITEPGKVWIAGGLPRPGLVGTAPIATLEVVAKQVGATMLSFDDTRVLRNDGLGSSMPLRPTPIRLRIEP